MTSNPGRVIKNKRAIQISKHREIKKEQIDIMDLVPNKQSDRIHKCIVTPQNNVHFAMTCTAIRVI